MMPLLLAVIVLVSSGLLALLAARSSGLSTVLGVLGVIASAAIGLPAVVVSLVNGTTEIWHQEWDVPYGSFTLALDPLAAFFAIPIFVLSALAAVYGSQYLLAHAKHRSLGPPWFFFNVLVASMLLVVLARNAVLFLFAWEVMSLASFFLVTFEDEKPQVRDAGRTYLIATHLGTAFLLVFFVLLAQQTGSCDFIRLDASAMSPAQANLLFLLALVGFGTKAGLMPLHVWLPEAHPAAPSHVSAVMSGVMVKTGVYGILRTIMLLPEAPAWWGWSLVGIGLLSGIWGIILAIAQHDLKRLLAYSTVENVGIIALGTGVGLLALSSGNPALAAFGFAGALLHVFNHALFKGLLFLGAGVVAHSTGTRELDRLGGLAKRMPGVAGTFLVGAVAIAGLPPLNGFVGEFLIYAGAFREETWLGTSSAAAALAAIASLALIGGLAAFCFAKVFGIAFLGEPRSEQARHAHAPGWLMTTPLVLLAAGCVLIGLCAPQVVSSFMPAVAQLTHQPLEAVATASAPIVEPLKTITLVSGILIFVAVGLALLRIRLLSRRNVIAGETWGCGYAQITTRMQYTASSFVQTAVDCFGPLLHTHTTKVVPAGIFPRKGWLATTTPDVPQEYMYRPLFGGIGWILSKLRWLQHGRVHLYVLYVGATIVALLVWYVSVKPSP